MIDQQTPHSLDSLAQRYADLVDALAGLFNARAINATATGADQAYRCAAKECRALARAMRGLVDDANG